MQVTINNGTATTHNTLADALEYINYTHYDGIKYSSTDEIAVKLLNSFSENLANPWVQYGMTLDFNGQTITASPDDGYYYALSLTDVVGTVTLTGAGGITTPGETAVSINNSTVVIEGGTYKNQTTNATGVVYASEKAKLTINGGTFESHYAPLSISDANSVTVNGGVFNATKGTAVNDYFMEYYYTAIYSSNSNLTIGPNVTINNSYSSSTSVSFMSENNHKLNLSAITDPKTDKPFTVYVLPDTKATAVLAEKTGLQRNDNTSFYQNALAAEKTYTLKSCHTIIYHANYPDGTDSTKRVDTALSGSKFSSGAEGFSKTGYDFVGWNTAANGSGTNVTGTAITETTTPTAYHVYAQWKAYAAKVTNASGGEIGKYESLAAAIAEAQKANNTGSTVTLLTDVSLSNTLTIDGGTFTIHLSKYNITNDGKYEALEITGANVTIDADSNSSTITGGNRSGPVAVGNNGVLTIQKGTFITNYEQGVSVIDDSNGTLNIAGGVFKQSVIDYGDLDGSTINISGGTFEGKVIFRHYGTVTGGSFAKKNGYHIDLSAGSLDMSEHPNPSGLIVNYNPSTEELKIREGYGYKSIKKPDYPVTPAADPYGYDYSAEPVVDVTFDYNDTSSDATDTKVVRQAFTGSIVQIPENAEKEGYSLAGWTYNADGTGGEVTAASKFSAKATVYAQWTPKGDTKYTVEHHFQKTDLSGYEIETELETGTTGAMTDAREKSVEGFTAKEVTQQKIQADGTTVVKIYYDRNLVEVKIDTDGDGDFDIDEKLPFGTTTPTPADKPVRDDYEFGGWQDENKNPVEFPATIPSSSITLFPIWNPVLPEFTNPTEDQIVTVYEGQQAVMKVAAENARTYFWERSYDGGKTWEIISGAADTTCTTSAATLDNNGYLYRCTAANYAGETKSAVFRLAVIRKASLPATGDDSHMNLWLALSLLGLCGMVAITLRGRKKEWNKTL